MAKWGVLAVLAAAQFLMVLDQAVMNVAISQLVEDFDTTVTTIQAVIAFYALVMAALMLTGGKVGDLWGRRRTFVVGPRRIVDTHAARTFRIVLGIFSGNAADLRKRGQVACRTLFALYRIDTRTASGCQQIFFDALNFSYVFIILTHYFLNFYKKHYSISCAPAVGTSLRTPVATLLGDQ